MKPKIVGMLSTYPNLNQSDWQWKQTPQPFGVWGNMQLQAKATKPDFLLLYQFDFVKFNRKPAKSWKDKLLFRKKTVEEPNFKELFRDVPKERIIYLLREPPLEEIVHLNQANYQQAKPYCGYISGPDDFAPVPDYMPAIWYITNSFEELNNAPPPEKVRFCSWITSGINRTASHQQRLNFLKMLRDYEVDFDLYGRNLPDWSGGLGQVANKWNVMAPYYYNLTVENYADNDWYVSEKLWDALLGWCLPIYYGGSAADRLLPPGSFLRLPSLDEKGVKYVQEIISTPDHWYAAKDAIAEARQVILHKLNLLPWLANYVENFS